MSAVIQNALNHFFQKHPVLKGSKIAVAVSGGADSLALALNLSEYAIRYHFQVYTLTVNHGLRAEAKAEVEYVHELLTPLGIHHSELLWRGVKPKTRVEEKAREKRYELMLSWCQKNDVRYLFLAHHQGDQAETFWLRLARGSGVDGLSAIAEISIREGVALCRPFLSLSKQQLEKDLERRKVSWVSDSMNRDEHYERVVWRNRQSALSEMNLTSAVVARSAERLNRAKQALEFYANRFMDSLVDVDPQGYATISLKALGSLPSEIQIRVLMNTIRMIAPQKAPVSLSVVEEYVSKNPITATFGGCILIRKAGLLYIAREYTRMAKAQSVPADTKTAWDRFIVLSSVPVKISVGRSGKGDIPSIVRRSVPMVENASVRVSFISGDEKELEKKYNLDYKEKRTLFLFKKGKK